MIEQAPLALLATQVQDTETAELLARRLGLPLLPVGTDPLQCNEACLVLEIAGANLSLRQTGKGAPGAVQVDFGSSAMRHRRRSGHNELLGKAAGVGKKPLLRVVDATAGLGRDSFVLADLGCEVTLCERQPVIATLLDYALRAGAADADPWLREVLQRMQLHRADARELPGECLRQADVIYLDPMFPPREKSAAVKKEMALFQLLLHGEAAGEDADELLLWALQQGAARVVVKRPARAPQLAGREPSHCISGKAVRYDVYVQRKLG
jgi:16S rRNA (guanine1516-N2)-methyltransferase